MKVAISTQGRDPDSAVDSRFGQAKCFLLTDTESGETTARQALEQLLAGELESPGSDNTRQTQSTP